MDDFDLELFLPYLLTRAAETSSVAFTEIYRTRYGMLRTEWRVMFHLGLYGAMSAKEISQRSGLHKTKISRAVAALEQKRMLSRTSHGPDRRVQDLHLTATGTNAFNDLRAAAAQHNAALSAQLTQDERRVLTNALRNLARRAAPKSRR